MNLVFGPARHESYVTQWLIEHPTGVRKVIDSISVEDSDFFCPMLVTR